MWLKIDWVYKLGGEMEQYEIYEIVLKESKSESITLCNFMSNTYNYTETFNLI